MNDHTAEFNRKRAQDQKSHGAAGGNDEEEPLARIFQSAVYRNSHGEGKGRGGEAGDSKGFPAILPDFSLQILKATAGRRLW